MFARTLASIVLILTLATPAAAGGKVIVTPILAGTSNGSFGCDILNASQNKVLEFTLQILQQDGSLLGSKSNITLAPRRSTTAQTGGLLARYCVMEVTSGRAKDVRMTVWVRDVGGALIAVLAAPSK